MQGLAPLLLFSEKAIRKGSRMTEQKTKLQKYSAPALEKGLDILELEDRAFCLYKLKMYDAALQDVQLRLRLGEDERSREFEQWLIKNMGRADN